MIKLTTLLRENINKDPQYWANEFNILGIIEQFDNQFAQRTGSSFYGKLNMLIFDRKDKKEVEKYIESRRFLQGYVPKGQNEFWDEDFMLTLDAMYPKNKLISELNPIKDKVFLLQLECIKDPKTKETVVALTSYW
jgi:hypothetical protein